MVCAGDTEVRHSKSAVLAKKRSSRRNLGPVEEGEAAGKKGRHSPEGNLAPVIGRWAEACFPVGSETTEAELHELAGGMKVHLPEGFETNGLMPRTDLRPIYETVASAVNKMLGALVDQRLALLLPLEVAQQHVPTYIYVKRTGP
jgi:hypothetical protein